MASLPIDYPPTQHTTDHFDCFVCKEANRMLYQQLSSDLTFKEAFDIWLSHRTIKGGTEFTAPRYLAPKSVEDYTVCSRALCKFFGKLPLKKIHAGHLMQYQSARATCDQSAGKWAAKAGANCIRKEIALLIRILTEAGTWKDADNKALIRLRAEESDVSRAMTPEEQHRFLHIASSREDWRFVHCYTIIALQTTCSTKEMRCLRLSDVSLPERFIQIRKASGKNKYRVRTIPLGSEEVIWALERLIERARSLGSSAPHHYLFPIYEVKGRTYNPLKPMSDSGLKKRWHEVRTAANVGWLKPNGLRHTAITRLAEAGAPIHVILAIAGHVTFRMQQHYIAVSMSSRREWVGAAWSDKREEMAEKRKGPVSVPMPPPDRPKMQIVSGSRSPVWVGTTFRS